MRALLALALFGACIGIVAADCTNTLPGWAQCGGRSNCNGDPNKCGDMQWKTYCCPSGYSCTRQGEWFWQCQPGNGAPSTPPPNNGGGGGGWTPPPPPSGPGAYKPDPPVPAKKIGSDWDWGQPLGLSFLFYEAQRSGKLPSNNRVAWRGDSGLDHKTNDGRDVTGGWYDAGDNVKFNFPMAWSAHVLAWSIVDFADGYYKAGQLGTALANVKWVTDYFIKCIGDGQRDIVVQVGSGSQDHGIWGRPEDIKNPVPVYTVGPNSPGSDVVAAMGATLGAASVAFSRADEAYSKQLLASAIKAYSFATQHTGKYSDSVSDAGAFYRSSNFYDDIAANAIWLYIATGQEQYKKAAFDYYMKHYKEEDGPGVWDNFDWDSHSWAAVVLLQRYFPEDPILKARVTKFVCAWTEGQSDIVKFTPKGLAYSGPWGSLRHVGNAMFLLKAWSVGSPNADPAIKQQIDCTVRKQLGYILGDTGRSFVVGYGTNPPARPHHRSSSCPPLGVQCTWDYYNNPGPNPHTLYGALVGGPGANDDYTDDRNDYIKNEVATDYNAGFTGALAAAARGLLPCQAGAAAAGAPVFTTAVEPLPKMAIQVLPAPYLKQAMEVVSGERVDATPLPQPLPAIEAPKVKEPAPEVPEVPAAAPVPAPVPAPAPKPFRPPQSLCFNWNDRTHQYEATTAEAREFLAALLGLKESSKGKAGLQGVIDVAARRVVKGPLGGHSAPVAKKAAVEPEHECVCPTHECAPCPAAAACPAHECAPCPTAAAAVKAADPAPAKAAAPTEPASSKKKKPLTKTKTEEQPPAKQVPATTDEQEQKPAPAGATAPAPTTQAPAQQPPAPQPKEAQQHQEEEHDEEEQQEEKQKQEEEEEEESQLSEPAAQTKPEQPSADQAPKAQQPAPTKQDQQPAPLKQEQAPEQHKPAPAKPEQKPEQKPAPAQPEQQPAPAKQEQTPEQQPEQKPAPAHPEQQQQPAQPQQPVTAAPTTPQDPATPATGGAADGQKKKKKNKKNKKATATPAEQPAGAAAPEKQPAESAAPEKQPADAAAPEKQPAPVQDPAAATPAPEQQQQPAAQAPAAPVEAQQPPAAAPTKPHKKKKKTEQPKGDTPSEGSKPAAQQPSETQPPAAASHSAADKEPSSGMTREKDLPDNDNSSTGSKASPAPASTETPTAQAATPAPADSPKQDSSSSPSPDNAAAQSPDSSSKAEKKKKKKAKKARKALNEADTPAAAATSATAAVAAAVPAEAAAAATAAAAMLTSAEV